MNDPTARTLLLRLVLPLALLVMAASSASPAQAQTAPADLLHAVATELAVSSAYRDQRAQVERLIDGDPTTAWNSRTGDLVGAWIEVRLPADASVTGIALIPGFARTGGETNLFTGNHRVARIRVVREGVELGSYPVANGAPVLVTVPVTGAGGVWRVEVTELLPGSRTDWREVCISELQILGTSPSMAPGTRTPRTAIGALPAPPAPVVVDAAALERTHRRDASWLPDAWAELSNDYFFYYESTGEPMPDDEARRTLEQARASILRRLVTLVEPVDAAAADALRIAGAHHYTADVAWSWEPLIQADLTAITAAMDAVAARIGSDAARCRSARAMAEIRLGRVARLAHAASYFDEIESSERAMMDEAEPPGAARRGRAMESEDAALTALSAEWPSNARGVATRLLRRSAPTSDRPAADWAALLVQLEAARTSCGWTAP